MDPRAVFGTVLEQLREKWERERLEAVPYYAREPAGAQYFHTGREGLRAFYEHLFSNDGGIPLEHCAMIDTGRECAIEYNVVGWASTELAPESGVAVYARGASGKLAAARIYDDVDPPIS